MAMVAFQAEDDRAQGLELLDLDAGSEPPQWLQVTGGTLLIITVAMLVCLWLKPITHPDLISPSHLSPSAFTVPVVRTLIPDEQVTPETTTVGPIASGSMPLQSAETGSTTTNTVAVAPERDV